MIFTVCALGIPVVFICLCLQSEQNIMYIKCIRSTQLQTKEGVYKRAFVAFYWIFTFFFFFLTQISFLLSLSIDYIHNLKIFYVF